MKRQILTFAAALAITAAPALFAQSTLNTPAPGPSQETKPGQTNNNLQNPGSNMQQAAPNQHGTYQEHGTVEGTTNESTTGTNDLNNGTGTVEGEIAPEPAGTGGFGYDPIFFYPPFGATLAQAGDRKSQVSHRGEAFRKVRRYLENQSTADSRRSTVGRE